MLAVCSFFDNLRTKHYHRNAGNGHQRKPGRTAKRDKDRSAYQEEFKAQKVAYITQKVGFTAEEAGKFWPLYNNWMLK